MSREHVVIYRIGELGDTLVSLPVIQAIHTRHPSAQFTLVTNPSAQPSHVNAWHVLQHTGVFSEALYLAPQIPSLLKLVAALRRRPADLLYYLAPKRTARQLRRDEFVFRHLCGIPRLYGLANLPRGQGAMPRDPQGQLLRLPRESERLLRAVGFNPTEVPKGPQLLPPASAQSRVQDLLRPLQGRRLLGVGPGSKMPAKRWFTDRFIQVLQRATTEDPELGVVILGGREDQTVGNTIIAALPRQRALNLAGQTNIIESAAALGHCLGYLGNDTGTMHLAAAMAVPCIGLFTSRDSPGLWEPWGEGHTILRHELPCSGCMLEVCEAQRMRCLDLIDADQAFRALRPLLQAPVPAQVGT